MRNWLRDLKFKILINNKPKNVQEIYKKHDLFVLPSVNEPASVSNLEAMSHGLAVITTDQIKQAVIPSQVLMGILLNLTILKI